ncbi:MAG: hypothetical protein ABIR82_14860 [Nocardioides sp.]
MAAVAPAVAEDGAQYVATNWKKIWKKQLRPLADQRYYTKVQSDTKYSTKTESGAALGNYYTKAQSDVNYYTKSQSDANYYKKTETYSRTEADARYAPAPKLIRGTYYAIGDAVAAGGEVSDNVVFGQTLSARPTVNYIAVGGVVPAACVGGTVEAPTATPGNLCFFEAQNVNVNSRTILDASGFSGSSTFGAGVWVQSTSAGSVFVYGSWAVRPLALANPAAAATSPEPTGVRAGR